LPPFRNLPFFLAGKQPKIPRIQNFGRMHPFTIPVTTPSPKSRITELPEKAPKGRWYVCPSVHSHALHDSAHRACELQRECLCRRVHSRTLLVAAIRVSSSDHLKTTVWATKLNLFAAATPGAGFSLADIDVYDSVENKCCSISSVLCNYLHFIAPLSGF
jgi:hypothetical protein